MKRDMLSKAIKLEEEIQKIEDFIKDCNICWKILYIFPARKSLFLRTGYGNKIQLPGELAEKILQDIEEYKNGLENELERL